MTEYATELSMWGGWTLDVDDAHDHATAYRGDFWVLRNDWGYFLTHGNANDGSQVDDIAGATDRTHCVEGVVDAIIRGIEAQGFDVATNDGYDAMCAWVDDNLDRIKAENKRF